MKMKKIVLLFIGCLFSLSLGLAQAKEGPVKQGSARGVWVSVFSSKAVLYAKDGVDNLIAQCKKAKINEIYLQFFQS